MANITNRIAPLYFHYYLAGHDSSVALDYIFRHMATEDRGIQYSEIDSLALMLPPHIKRDFAQKAFSAIIDMVKLHAANPAQIESAVWGNCQDKLRLYVARRHLIANCAPFWCP